MTTNNQGKRDFGSFFSSNVEELIRLNEDEYRALELPIKFDFELSKDALFGSLKLKQDLFYLNNDYIFLNHGAFGCTFKPVIDYNHKLQAYSESQPLKFYDREVMPLMVHVIRRLANILKCKPSELVLVENCTFAFNSVLNSIEQDLKPHDEIFIFNTTYGVYKKILRKYCANNEVNLIEETIEFPLLTQDDIKTKVIDKFKQVLEEHDSIKYVFIDYIPSNHSFIMPIKHLIDICHSYKHIKIIIDAAHAFGSIDNLNLSELNADILFGNCHKWLCASKGTGFLFKKENIQIKPCVLSHGLDSGFHSEFMWIGLKDYCSYLALHSTLDLWSNHLGGFTNVIQYCNNLAKKASLYLKEKWNTEFLVHPDFCASMVLVRLPLKFIQKCVSIDDKLTYDQAELVQNYLHFKHNIEIPIKSIQNNLYVRLSCHIYNNFNEFKYLCDVIHE